MSPGQLSDRGLADTQAEGESKDLDPSSLVSCNVTFCSRGVGLFIGVDLIKDEATRMPATEEADYVVSRYFFLETSCICSVYCSDWERAPRLPLLFDPRPQTCWAHRVQVIPSLSSHFKQDNTKAAGAQTQATTSLHFTAPGCLRSSFSRATAGTMAADSLFLEVFR